jgi:AcrR family transcriptional regulator
MTRYAGGMVATTPITGGRRERNATRTRNAITDAARHLFDEQGYDGTTIEQIAEQADVAPRTVFRYFPTKESILFAEFEDVRRGILERLDAAFAAEPGADPLTTLLGVLDVTTAEIQERLEKLSWGFHVAQEHAVPHNDTVLRTETVAALAQRLADQLGVDPEQDPRPYAWASIATTVFGLSLKTAAQDDTGSTRVRTVFRRLVRQTGAAFTASAAST